MLFYTGWDSLYGRDNLRQFNSPGPGIEVAKWLADKRIATLGTDTQHGEAAIEARSTELAQNPDVLGRELGFVFNAVHFILITQHGIHLMEWMRLGELAEALLKDHRPMQSAARPLAGRRPTPYEFLFVYSPLPVKGLPAHRRVRSLSAEDFRIVSFANLAAESRLTGLELSVRAYAGVKCDVSSTLRH